MGTTRGNYSAGVNFRVSLSFALKGHDLKKRPRSANTRSSHLLGLQNRVRGARAPREAAGEIREDLDVESFPAFEDWLRRFPFALDVAANQDHPSSYKQLMATWPLRPLSLDREIFWAGARIRRSLKPLDCFLCCKKILSDHILLSQFGDALRVLDDLETEVGKSIWAMKLRIALLQKKDGLESQKKFAASVRQQSRELGFIQYFASHVSVRNEGAMTPPNFRSSFNKRLAESEMPENFKAYALYHILPDTPLDADGLAAVLNFESAAPVVDHYEALMRVAPSASVRGSAANALEQVLSQCRQLPDARVEESLTRLGTTPNPAKLWQPMNIQALNDFLAGRYDAAWNRAVGELTNGRPGWEYIELAGRVSAAGRISDSELLLSPMASDLIRSVRVICSYGEVAQEEVSHLTKSALNYSGLPWSDGAFGFLRQSSRHDAFNQYTHCSLGVLYGSELLHPLMGRILPLKLKSMHEAMCRSVYGASLAIEYATWALSSQPTSQGEALDSRHLQLITSTQAIQQNQWQRALAVSGELTTETSDYFRKPGIALHSLALLGVGDVLGSLRYTIGRYVCDFTLHSLLPIAQLTERIATAPSSSFVAEISVPVLFDMYCRHVATGREAERQYAIEDFLIAHGLQRPSQLGSVAGQFDRATLIYFLKVVCTPANMDEARAFSGTADLQDERVAICLLLGSLDPDGQDLYQNEVKEITRRQVIDRGMRQVEMSKIYVDLAGVRSTAEGTLRESFNRYHAFEESGVELAIEQVIEALRKVTKEGERSMYIALKLPENEKSAILRGLVFDFRDIFVSSTEHGLDGYLSTRIRHGTLSGQLRSPLQALRLVTQRETDTGQYKVNEFWAERSDLLGSGIGTKVGAELAAFSESFDNIVQSINAKWLRIKKLDDDGGLFDFRLQDPLVRVIGSHVTSETSFEEFLDILGTFMWKMLDENLEVIRAKLSQEIKQEIDQLFLRLQTFVQSSSAAADADTSELERAIVTARTEMQHTITRITDWFRLPTQTPNRPFQCRIAIDIAVETINKYRRDYTVHPTVSVSDDLVFPGFTLPALVDIFFILLENIVKHSHTEAPPSVRIAISADAGTVHVAVSNDVVRGIEDEGISQRLASIREAIAGGDYLQSVPREGGTGFHKIRKIVTHDIGELEQLDFDFVQGTQFVVQMLIRPYKDV